MEETKQRQRKRNEKSNQLKVGDRVIIANRFYHNHGMKIVNSGIGTVREIVPAWESKLPAVKVVFSFNPAFFQYSNNGYMKISTFKDANGFMMLVRIHPVYLEKVK